MVWKKKTPVPSVQKDDPDRTPVPTPRVRDEDDTVRTHVSTPRVLEEREHDDGEPDIDMQPEHESRNGNQDNQVPNKRRKTTETVETELPHPPGIRLRRKTRPDEIPSRPPGIGTQVDSGMPGSTIDHIDNDTDATSVAVDVVSQATHDGSVRVISDIEDNDEDDSSSTSSRSSNSSCSCSEKMECGGDDDNKNYPDSDSRSRSDRNRNQPSVPSSRTRLGHRERSYRKASVFAQAFVARNVSHKERRKVPEAHAAMKKEWDNLRSKGCWDEENPRDWDQVRKEAKASGKTVHVGRLAPLCVEKNSELSPDDPARKYKGRVVFQGNMVKD